MSADLPIVDLTRGAEEVASTIRDVCVKHGFFYVTGHGVPDEVVEGMFVASKEFFALPEDKKKTCLQDENNRGWTPLGEETLVGGKNKGKERSPFDHSLSTYKPAKGQRESNLSPCVRVYTISVDAMTDTTHGHNQDPARQKTGDTKEGYYIGREVEPGSAEHGLPLRGPNNWPDEAALGLTSFRGPVQSYYDHMCDLARRLMPSFEAALGLEKNFFSDKFSHPTALLRPLKYAAAASDPRAGKFAAGAHSDYGVLTILATDGTPGLQTTAGKDEWKDVGHVPGTFVCNVGDLCERWTNGFFKSTVHRVVTTGERERFSCAFFWEPNFDTAVAPLPQCVSEERPARYPPTTYGEYILGKYAETHSGFD